MPMRKYFIGLFGAQHEIEKKLADYLQQTEAMAVDMQRGVEAYLKQDLDGFSRLFDRINEAEHRLDTLRREIEEEIYRRRLLPDTRGDLLGLLESVDKIPNRIQALTRELVLQKIQVPQRLHSSLLRLADRDLKIVQVLTQTARAFLDKPEEVKEGAKELSYHEHEGDVVEQEALALTFDHPGLELAHKLQLHRLIDDLGSICDIAEDVGDRLVIAALKRLL
jgi:predicted phosphate transport protein (TIGR00153 family)